jgi:hypothetical protein
MAQSNPGSEPQATAWVSTWRSGAFDAPLRLAFSVWT